MGASQARRSRTAGYPDRLRRALGAAAVSAALAAHPGAAHVWAPPGRNLPGPEPVLEEALAASLRGDAGALVTRLPALASDALVMAHRKSGLSIRFTPRGMFLRRPGGAPEPLWAPAAVAAEPERDAVLFPRLYPSLSQRYITGADFLSLELLVAEPPDPRTLAGGVELLVVWAIDLKRTGLIMQLDPTPGGIAFFDEAGDPALWLMQPGVKAGQDPVLIPWRPPPAPADALGYELAAGAGDLELTLRVDLGKLVDAGSSFPLIVHAATVALDANH